MRFGKDEGARDVVFSGDYVRYTFAKQPVRAADPERQPAGAARRASSPPTNAPPSVLSKRKQRSAARLLEFQQRRRLRECRLRKVVLQVMRRVRLDRLWRVYGEHARHNSTSARDGAEAIALETTRMDDDRGTKRAADGVELRDDTTSSPPPSQRKEAGSPSGGGLNPTALEFVPSAMAEVEMMQYEMAHDSAPAAMRGGGVQTRRERREKELAKELRAARRARREADEAMGAASVAKHQWLTELHKAGLRHAPSAPLTRSANRALARGREHGGRPSLDTGTSTIASPTTPDPKPTPAPTPTS